MTNLKPVFQEVTSEDYKTGFLAAADWLDQLIVETDHGIYWEQPGSDEELLDIYAGSAGIVLFYIELDKFNQDKKYTDIIKKAGDYLLYYIENTDLSIEKPGIAGLPFRNGQWSYNTGYTGIAFALIEITKHTGDEKYAQTGREITEKFLADITVTDEGAYMADEAGILADGGNLLYLIYASRYFENQDYLETAIQFGDYILSTAEVVDDHKIKFHPLDQKHMLEFSGLDPEIQYEWPNFEYGTAGTGFVLAKLYQATQDEKYLEAAIKASNYIDSIAVPSENGEGILIPYRLPDLNDVFYLGYCHGPAGTARLYHALYEITQEDHYKNQAFRLARGIIETDAPHVHSDGYWHTYQQCCGTASFIELFLTTDKQAEDDEFVEYAKESAIKLLSEANEDENGAYWTQHWTRTDPLTYTRDIGYFLGVAGIGSSLLRLYSFLEGETIQINFVDSSSFETKE